MSFREQPFNQRFAVLGDTAEAVYDAVLPLGNGTQFGFRRPKGIKFNNFPENLRHMPDRVTATYMVEVMGMGRDGILRSMKVTKFNALKVWNTIAPKLGLLGVALFVWNSHKKQYLVLSFKSMTKLVNQSMKDYGIQTFEVDGVEYYRINWDDLRKEALLIGEYDG